MARRFTKTPSGNQVLDRIQDSVAQVLNPLATNPANNSLVLTSVSLSTGLNAVPHTLGRALQGWLPVRVRAQVQLWDSQDSGASPDKFLYLNASAPAVVDLEVF